jgi:hypothetical protein
MTVGVLSRVETLADRSEAEAAPPATAGAVSNLVALPEMLGEIASSGPSSKTVERGYGRLLSALGPELDILQAVPLEDISRADSSVLAEAVARLRAGKVIRDAGYDGEYGVIRLFEPDELRHRTAGGMLFESPAAVPVPVVREGAQAKYHPSKPPQDLPTPIPNPSPQRGGDTHAAPGSGVLSALDPDQRAAAAVVEGPLLIVAGPGSGKTRTLVHRIAHLVADCGVAGAQCLAITFTRRAAAEMRDRLHAMLGPDAGGIAVHTFHSLGLAILREHAAAAGLTSGFRVAGEAERAAALAAALGLPRPRAENLIRAISKAERGEAQPNGEIAAARTAYRAMLAADHWIDFDDLVSLAVRLLADNAEIAALYRARFRFVCVDEFQDVDARQYRLLTLLAPPAAGNLCVIGDPHQAIYGFRGADAACFERFGSDYPGGATIALRRNYRSGGAIVAASSQVIAAHADEPIAEIVRERRERITIHAAPGERAEAELDVIRFEQAIGGSSFFAIDSSRTGGREAALSFTDFAVLYRTDAQAAVLCEALARSGIPFRRHSHAALAQEPSVRAVLEAYAAMAPADIDLPTRLRQRRRFLGRARRGRGAVDLACRQGTGIRLRLHRRPGGRRAAAALGQGRGCGAGGVGRGAPAVLCRHDSREGSPGAEPRAQAAVARPRAHAKAFAVPRRHRKRAAQGAAGRAPAPARGSPAQAAVALDCLVDTETSLRGAQRARKQSNRAVGPGLLRHFRASQ